MRGRSLRKYAPPPKGSFPASSTADEGDSTPYANDATGRGTIPSSMEGRIWYVLYVPRADSSAKHYRSGQVGSAASKPLARRTGRVAPGGR